MAKKKKMGMGEIVDQIFGNSPSPSPLSSDTKSESEERIELDEDLEDEVDLENTITLESIAVILGASGRALADLTSQILADFVSRKYIKLVENPETVFQIGTFCKDVLPSIIANHRNDNLLIITTSSIPIIETLKSYVRNKKITRRELVFLYADAQGIVTELELTDDGEWVQDFPDDSYEVTANALKSFLKKNKK